MDSLNQDMSNVNPLQDLRLCDDLLTLASSSYLHSNDYEIKANMRSIIRSQLPPGFKNHVTPRGVTIEIVDNGLSIHPFVTLLSGDPLFCAGCEKEMRPGHRGCEIRSMVKEHGETRITVECECGYFTTILEGGEKP